MNYRKKPVVIQAIQWTGDNLKDVIALTGLNQSAEYLTWEEFEQLVAADGLKIFTLEGKMNADLGDYIIKGIKGEVYPCKPDVFEASYDKVD